MSFSEIKFRPAQYYKGKECYVAYYVVNPFSNTWVRKKVKLNHIRKSHVREKYANALIHDINSRLYDGWNPFLDDAVSNGCPSLFSAVRDFIDLKSRSLRADSMRCYRSYAGRFCSWLGDIGYGDRLVALFSSDDARRFMRLLEFDSCVSNKTYNNYLRFMCTLFQHFVHMAYIKDNPFSCISHKRCEGKVRTVIPPEDRARILEYFRASDEPEFVYVMLLCYRLLVRPKEILMLRVGDIDFRDCLLVIPSSVAKNHHSRTLALPDDIMSYFRSISGFDKGMFIFSDRYRPGCNMRNTRDVGRTWSRMRDDLQLPLSYQFYSLKDTGITEMLEQGVPPKMVMELADHHSLEMTERYTHKSDAKKILEWNRLEF